MVPALLMDVLALQEVVLVVIRQQIVILLGIGNGITIEMVLKMLTFKNVIS